MDRAPYIVFFILLFLSSFCESDDHLTHAKPLTPDSTLVSQGGDFALGFFPTTSSNKSLYLGIWYNNIPLRTVVWVANRDNPITAPSSAMLVITNSSDLVLSDSQDGTVWVTKNNITTGGTGAAAVLLNTGNFVVRLPNGTVIWQSFDHPTDTILPTMRFLVSYKSQIVGRLVASKGPDDPSSGGFSYNGDPSSRVLQTIIWNGTRPYYRGIRSGETVFGGRYLSNSSSILYQTTAYLGDELYFEFTVSDGSPYLRITLDYTGRFMSLSWNNQSSSWVVIDKRPAAACDVYSSCGSFGYCDLTSTAPTCQCLGGFEPNGSDASRGCRRTETLTCGKQSQFVAFPGMKLPDKFLHIANRSFDECAAECSSNCSCTAYAYVNVSRAIAKGDMSRCLVWTGKLIDTGKSNNAFFTEGQSSTGEYLYLRLANSRAQSAQDSLLTRGSRALMEGTYTSGFANSPGQKNSNLVKIVFPVITCLLILTCISLISILKYRGKRRKKEIEKRLMLGYFSSSTKIRNGNIESPFASFKDITAATGNFSDSNLIGRGGFGKVYKGTLEGGMEVAIKRLSEGSKQGIEEFKNEIVLFAKVQHKNLVRLLGCCIHGDERLLLYEYLPNKSLDAFLFDATRQSVLDWPTRFRIIKGVARGLLYLHQDSRLTIIHRDLKASNILLDTEMNPKIADFGMARIFGENQQQADTTRVVGTYGYMSPEYVMRGSFSVKSDTYSFGVLLLEIVSGLKISSPQLIMNFSSLTAYAWRVWEDGRASELVDSSLVESCPLHEVLRCIQVGLLCVQDHPNDRPLMSSVIFMLENESALLPAPKQPLYFAPRNSESKETKENTENSMNAMSITRLEGR